MIELSWENLLNLFRWTRENGVDNRPYIVECGDETLNIDGALERTDFNRFLQAHPMQIPTTQKTSGGGGGIGTLRPELYVSNAKPSRPGLWWYRERNHPAGRGLMLALISRDLLVARLIHISEGFDFLGDTEESIASLDGQWAGPETVPIFTAVEDVDEIQGPGAVDVPVR